MPKITIRLSQDLLEQIDDRAESDEDTRSGVVREGMKKYLDNPTKDGKLDDLRTELKSVQDQLGVLANNIEVNHELISEVNKRAAEAKGRADRALESDSG